MTGPLPLNMRRKIEFTECSVVGLSGPCFTWTGCVNSKGYGCVSVAGKSQLSHRVAYALMVGQIPSGAELDHLCRNRRCCNPRHLEPVTRQVNSDRSPFFNKPRCVNGHDLVGPNLIIKKRGTRSSVRNCRTCANDRRRAARLVAL